MKHCLACGQESLKTILNFGDQTAANLLLDNIDLNAKTEKLALDYCSSCGHAQQSSFYPPEDLFSHYLYQSGTSNTLRDYFEWFSDCIYNSSVDNLNTLEIASNDGSLIRTLLDKNIHAEGIEPAKNLVEIARANGIKTTEGFWPTSKFNKKFDIVIAQNVLAHNANPFEFTRAIYESLSDEGTAFLQSSQVEMFENYEFDTVYHEHFSFFSPNSMRVLAERAGFKYNLFIKTNIHGGSLLGIFSKSEVSLGKFGESFSSGKFYMNKINSKQRPLDRDADKFTVRATETCNTLKELSSIYGKSGYKVVLVGAAAKAITILQASKLDIDFVIDEAPLKHGKYIAGTKNKIDRLEIIDEINSPILFIIGAWNFYSELKSKLSNIRGRENQDRIIRYFPRLVIEDL